LHQRMQRVSESARIKPALLRFPAEDNQHSLLVAASFEHEGINPQRSKAVSCPESVARTARTRTISLRTLFT
jgi:hypothetical protein